MEIIKKQKQKEVEVGTLNYGDIFQTISGRIFMVVDSTNYVINGVCYDKDNEDVFKVIIVDLEKGILDRMSSKAKVRPIKLVAKEI